MRGIISEIVFICLVTVTSLAHASEAYPPKSYSDILLSGLDNSVFDSAIEKNRTSFEINAAKDNSTVSLKIGKDFSKPISSNLAEFSSWAITFSAPVNKNSENTDIATLDGLANSFKLSVKLSNFIVLGKLNPFVDDPKNPPPRLVEICKLAGINYPEDPCDTDAVYSGLEKRNKLQIYPEFKSLFWKPTSWKLIYGIEGSIGYQNFEFISKQTYEKKDQDKYPMGANAFFGAVPPGQNAVLTVGGQFQESYKESKTQTVCPVTTTGTSFVCDTGALGEPGHKQKQIVYVEGRTEFLSLGLNIRVSHDFKNYDTGIDAPVYIFHDKKNNLNGGLRFGWTKNDHKALLGVFVGGSFSLFD
jgi:hypothetical protein